MTIDKRLDCISTYGIRMYQPYLSWIIHPNKPTVKSLPMTGSNCDTSHNLLMAYFASISASNFPTEPLMVVRTIQQQTQIGKCHLLPIPFYLRWQGHYLTKFIIVCLSANHTGTPFSNRSLSKC